VDAGEEDTAEAVSFFSEEADSPELLQAKATEEQRRMISVFFMFLNKNDE